MSIIDSKRVFQLWRARVSHLQVLLRSTQTEDEPTRVEVLFKGVFALKLRTLLVGLCVREAQPEELAAIGREVGDDIRGFRVFVVESGSFSGYVVALVAVTAEDRGSYSDPSSLFVD